MKRIMNWIIFVSICLVCMAFVFGCRLISSTNDGREVSMKDLLHKGGFPIHCNRKIHVSRCIYYCAHRDFADYILWRILRLPYAKRGICPYKVLRKKSDRR